MKRIARFEKVSYDQFKKDFINSVDYKSMCLDDVSEDIILDIYHKIKLPERKTKGSAGYDFHAPTNLSLFPNETVKFPTGIRVHMEEGWVLKCYPRSGLGFRFRLQLDNMVGIIDEDFYYSNNEGHIMAKLTNDTNTNKDVFIKQGDGFMQGIFVEFGITEDDSSVTERNGGFGSTTK
jgi:dUTP pyrophosphatase